ncbi:hypothetical protein ANCCAN_17183 [Ancylostoma caninum]|uniref:G-protein coupled receptors family 1 profile domain-containing protein n=1 Tax=Ancylostoma caninum TaxID=29170 RepID=A0A368G1M1_ANCCA|nr:hypothetical protein ANCCAN_17183 [Ancylostoma caninum]
MDDYPTSMKVNHMDFLESLANYSDFILPEEIEDISEENEFFMTAVGIAVIILALMGILTNILVLVLSFCHVTGDFGNFVANLAVVDIVCGVVFAFMGYINVEDDKKLFSFQYAHYSLTSSIAFKMT